MNEFETKRNDDDREGLSGWGGSIYLKRVKRKDNKRK
jgi:hypothetical protein